MRPSLKELRSLIARAARQELLPRFARVSASRKTDGSLVTEADLAMQQAVQRTLAQRWPEIALLGEEMTRGEQQRLLQADGPLWCLDPLDGTSNFTAGIPFFAVSLALIEQGEVTLGLVYDPCRNECFSATRGEGAWVNGEPLAGGGPGRPLNRAIGLVDFKRLSPALARRLASEPPYRSQRNFGSGALDWCFTAAGRCDVYLHGGQQLWDLAAGSLVLTEAGGRAVTLAGETVFRPALTPRSVVAARDPATFKQWCSWLGVRPHARR